MLRRVSKAFRCAVREDDFLNVFGAGVLLVVIGTLTYLLGAGWNVVDSQARGAGAYLNAGMRGGSARAAVSPARAAG
jgi:hypothetical protein